MKTLFLDLDGTLTDISQRHFDVYCLCVDQYNGTPLPKDEYWALKRDNLSWGDILTLSAIQSDLEKDFLSKFIEIIETPDELDKDSLFPEVLASLESLSKDYQLVLVSLRRNRKELLEQLERLGVSKLFRTVLSGHSETVEGTLAKKAEAIREWGTFKDGVIVGDTEADMSAARQLNIRSIAVTTGIRSRSYLENYEPDVIVDSFAEAIAYI